MSSRSLLSLFDTYSASNSYQYSVLNKPDDIRLVLINPGSDDDEISCTLTHHSIKNKPLYQALSYTWDNNVRTHSVKISKDILPVTANLHSALKCFRSSVRQRALWVDAICINQNDIEERERQIGIMGLIYSYATEVLIWLGDEPDNVEEAFKLIAKFENELDMQDPEFIHSMHQVTSSNSTLWRAFSSILNKSWFTRAWVVQEVVLAAHAQVFCGSQTSTWDALSKTVNWIFDNNLDSWQQGLAHLAVSRITLIQKLWRKNEGPTDGPIILLLDLFKYTESTESRDKVYAFLSLTSDTPYFSPNYRISCEELYTSVAVRHLDSDFSYVLCCVDCSINNSGLRLPSWVPNWEATNIQSAHRISLQFSKFWGFKAAAETHAQWTYSEHDQVLSVTGFVFDTILQTAEYLYDTTQNSSFGLEDFHDKFGNMKSRFQEFDEIAALSGVRPGMNISEDSYSRLFIMNQPIKLENSTYPSDQLHRIGYQATREILLHLDDIISGNMKLEDINDFATTDAYLNAINKTIIYKRLCATKRHHLGWLPEAGAVGDLVCIFYGAGVPFILRPTGNSCYKLIGPCYIQGMMYGEGMTSDVTEQIFNLC